MVEHVVEHLETGLQVALLQAMEEHNVMEIVKILEMVDQWGNGEILGKPKLKISIEVQIGIKTGLMSSAQGDVLK